MQAWLTQRQEQKEWGQVFFIYCTKLTFVPNPVFITVTYWLDCTK